MLNNFIYLVLLIIIATSGTNENEYKSNQILWEMSNY